MEILAESKRIWIYGKPVPMQSSINGLTRIVEKEFKKQLVIGEAFLFFNKKRDYVKILWTDGKSILCLARKLEEGSFKILPISRRNKLQTFVKDPNYYLE